MGRNSDKRRVRKDVRDEQQSAGRQVRRAEAAVLARRVEDGPAPPWWAEAMRSGGGFEDDPATLFSAALFRISALLVTGDLGPETEGAAFSPVVQELAALLSVDTLSIHRLHESSDDNDGAPRLERVAATARLVSDEPLLAFSPDDAVAGEALSTGKSVRIDDAPRDPRLGGAHGQRSHVGSLLAAPMRAFGRRYGVMVATRKEARGFYDADERRVAVLADCLAQDLVQARRMREALIDPETGLFSRMALLEALPRELERARRYDTPLSVLMLHVDGLRDVAERFGLAVTCELLAEVGRRLPEHSRRADLTVRFGADVFLVLSPTDAEEAGRAAERLVSGVSERPFYAGDVEIPLAVAASAATLQDDDEDAFALLLRAEASLPAPGSAPA
jgi:diguanylate cyclase (GGDEF)-like protein